MSSVYIPHCWICGRTVSPGNSQIDDNDLAVHESCYVTKVALARGTIPTDRSGRAAGVERDNPNIPNNLNRLRA
jgi:hypothetical protein